MNQDDFTLDNYFKKVSHSQATPEQQEGKLVTSTGLFVQNAIQLVMLTKILNAIKGIK